MSSQAFGPKIWNSLSVHIKLAENVITFQRIIKTWNGVHWEYTVCANNLPPKYHFCYNNF